MEETSAPDWSVPEQPLPEAPPAGFWTRAGAALADALLLVCVTFLRVPGLPFLAGLAYKTGFVANGGQTPGKMGAGIRVVRVDGSEVAYGRSLGRALAEHLSALPLGLGYLAAAFGPKRALHDFIAGTRVVRVEGVPAWRPTAFAAAGALGFASLVLILAVVAGPAFRSMRNLQRASGEGETKGGLGSLRAAASIYYGDKEGVYPQRLDELVPQYVPGIPQTKLHDHARSDAVEAYGAEVCTGSPEYGQEIDASRLKDTGGWGYVSDPKAACYGTVFVDCTHPDSKGRAWTSF